MTESALTLARYPLNATFELTARCNLACKMCFIRVDERRIAELGTRELTTQEWIGLARQAAELGTFKLLITGGEPMLRPDFVEIYEAILQMGFYVILYTNATMITPRIKDLLTKYPPHEIGVTIYGASEETYGRLCGVPGAFHRALEGIKFLHTLPSRLELRTTYVKDNVADMQAIRALAAGIDDDIPLLNNFSVTKAVRGGIADPVSARLSPEENVKMVFDNTILSIKKFLDNKEKEKRGESTRKGTIQYKDTEQEEKKLSIYGCGGGTTQYTVTWNGRLIACQMMDEKGVDVVENTLAGAWEEYPYTVSFPGPAAECASCEWVANCSSCPADRKAETGSVHGISEYHCKLSEAFYQTNKHYEKRGKK